MSSFSAPSVFRYEYACFFSCSEIKSLWFVLCKFMFFYNSSYVPIDYKHICDFFFHLNLGFWDPVSLLLFFSMALPSKNFFSLLSFRPCGQLHFDWSWQVLWILDHPTWTYEPLDTLFSILTFVRGKLLHHNHYSSSSLSSSCAKNISSSLILVDYNWRRLKELGYWVFFFRWIEPWNSLLC